MYLLLLFLFFFMVYFLFKRMPRLQRTCSEPRINHTPLLTIPTLLPESRARNEVELPMPPRQLDAVEELECLARRTEGIEPCSFTDPYLVSRNEKLD